MSRAGHARGGRPRGTVGAVRRALLQAVQAGLSDSAEFLAAHTGWPPAQVRATLKEMARAGEVHRPAARHVPGVRGSVSAPVLPPQPPALDALAFARQVWR